MRFLFYSIVSGLTITLYSQVPELKKASDKAHEIIHVDRSIDPELLRYVNPFIGTGGHGHTFPGATLPFGMVQLSPDTRKEGWDGCGGYHYSDSVIFGFSHTHLSGTGVPDYADLLITPHCGKAPKQPRYIDANGYGSRFSHSKEKASPGFYSVYLEDTKIEVSLTATEHTGIHKYRFEGQGKRYIVLDLDYRDKVLDAGFTLIDKQRIQGHRTSEGWAKQQHFYFSLYASVPFEKSELITEGNQHRLVLCFNSKVQDLELQVGISAVDEAGAERNRKKEAEGYTFEQCKQQAEKHWLRELSKIQIEDSDHTKKSLFYTALYHTMVAPNLFSDVDGRYRGRDMNVYRIDNKYPQYTVFSLWDTYRATHPLFTIIDQKRTNAFIKTFLRQFKEGKDLPVWELAGNETECMIGFHSASVIADAYVKGIRDYNAEEALSAMVYTSNLNEYGKTLFRDYGLISSDWESESVSKSLEYAYDHWCIGQMAKAMGKLDIAKKHEQYGLNFINHFDPKTSFMRARRGAQWVYPFDPTEVNFNYTEANSWQYSLYAPHQPHVLTKLMGGGKDLSAWLDRLFTTSSNLSGREQADITGLIGQYAHGNEPSHHMAYLYNYSATPWKTSFYVDSIQRTMYQNSPDGLAGNEDCGQMSAWYVLSALGFYPIAPGSTRYEMGHPIFKKASIRLENGNTLNVVRLGSQGKYIQTVRFNGNEIKYIDHAQLMQGGTIAFEMGDTPNMNLYFTQEFPKPYDLEFIPVPYIHSPNRIFKDSVLIEMGMVELKGEKQGIEYALEVKQTMGTWKTYTEPFVLKESTKVHVRGLNTTGTLPKYSASLSAIFTKTDGDCALALKTDYAPAYAAAGPNTIIDKIRGSNDFRTGDWQGFYGKDVIAEVTFVEPRDIHTLGISYLRDLRSWIFDPSSIAVEISMDGKTYTQAAEFSIEKAKKETEEKSLGDLSKKVAFKQVKAIRYTIKNQGVCPEWHLGAGNPTWIFLDELIFD
jgi:predicted alpha-1,2-mannosidase